MAWLKAGDQVGAERTFECKVRGSYLGALDGGKEYVEVLFDEVNGAGEQAKKLWLTDAGWQHAEKCLKILGWDAEARDYQFEELGRGDESPIAGAACEIVVIAEASQDGSRVYNNVAFVNAVGGGRAPREKMSGEDAKGFADRIRRKLQLGAKGSRQKRVEKAAKEGIRRQQGKKEGAGDDADDGFESIPF